MCAVRVVPSSAEGDDLHMLSARHYNFCFVLLFLIRCMVHGLRQLLNIECDVHVMHLIILCPVIARMTHFIGVVSWIFLLSVGSLVLYLIILALIRSYP